MEKIIPNCKKLDMQYILMPIVINPDLKITAQHKSKNNKKAAIGVLKFGMPAKNARD